MTRAFVYQIRSLPEIEQIYLLERVAATGARQALPYKPTQDILDVYLLSTLADAYACLDKKI